MKHSESINELVKALSIARKNFKEIKKNKEVDFETKSGRKMKYKYADLPEIHEATIEFLSDNGLVVSQGISDDDKNIETVLLHSSGQWVKTRYPLIPDSDSSQSVGAAYTYARRYAINGILNISSEEDTDGEPPKDPNAGKKPNDNHKPKEEKKPLDESPISMNEAGYVYALAQSSRGLSKVETDAMLLKNYKVSSATKLKRSDYENIMFNLRQKA